MSVLRRWAMACVLACASTWIGVFGAVAQALVWVQIEAHPTLATAQSRANAYAQELEDVSGFRIGNSWYAIALGPYTPADANQVLQSYRSQRLIPRDSYIAFSNTYGQQFWPIGATDQNQTLQPAPEQNIQTTPVPQPAGDETPAQARRSEQALSRGEREDLQIALQWAGYYNAAIDGSFGRGTRASMSDWQAANGFETTGILTTQQRAMLLDQYNAVLKGMDLQVVRDDAAGIEMQIPLGVVQADGYEYPFANFTASNDLGAQVLLISQSGGQSALFGLYDIMQTLEIVPLDGNRERRRNSFLLIGQNDTIVSHTEAELNNGQIKGFTLVWPAGDEDRRKRVLQKMRDSFQRIDGVLDPSWSDDTTQAVDLIAGLQVRKPKLSRSGVFVNISGTVVTTQEAVQGCARVTLDDSTQASVTALKSDLGLAVLTPDADITPRRIAKFAQNPPRLQSEAALSGFSYEGVLGAPTVTFGQVSDVRGLQGEDSLLRLSLESLDGDAGGPVFDSAGAVMGILATRATTGRQLPREVNFAINAQTVQAVLGEIGVVSDSTASQAPMAPEDITALARDVTVLVNCWD
ncbi:MAG: serine protease [Paracoccaceae bacterium]